MARHLAPFSWRQRMAEMVRRRSFGCVLPLGRHASTNGSKFVHCASDTIALSSFQKEQNARHHKQFKREQALATNAGESIVCLGHADPIPLQSYHVIWESKMPDPVGQDQKSLAGDNTTNKRVAPTKDEVDRAWEIHKDADLTFNGRVNLFLVAQPMFFCHSLLLFWSQNSAIV